MLELRRTSHILKFRKGNKKKGYEDSPTKWTASVKAEREEGLDFLGEWVSGSESHTRKLEWTPEKEQCVSPGLETKPGMGGKTEGKE